MAKQKNFVAKLPTSEGYKLYFTFAFILDCVCVCLLLLLTATTTATSVSRVAKTKRKESLSIVLLNRQKCITLKKMPCFHSFTSTGQASITSASSRANLPNSLNYIVIEPVM